MNNVKNEINNVKNEINNIDITSYIIKTINTIIKDLTISPQWKLYIYINSKPACITGLKGVKDAAHEMINENNNFKYYLYDIKDMFLITKRV